MKYINFSMSYGIMTLRSQKLQLKNDAGFRAIIIGNQKILIVDI